jgi:hypothetical protein
MEQWFRYENCIHECKLMSIDNSGTSRSVDLRVSAIRLLVTDRHFVFSFKIKYFAISRL